MSKNNYWILQLKEEEPKLFTSWPECEKFLKEEKSKHSASRLKGKEEVSRISRVVCHGFPTKAEAEKFIAGKWRGKPISKEAGTWLEEYKAKPGQLKLDTELDKSELSSGEYPKCCAYVDGSYDPRSEIYGFGVVFICDGKIEKFYGGGKEKELINMECGAGELLACMEAIKHAETLGLPELTIIYDSELISWAYLGCGKEMLTQAAGQYMYDIREKMEIEVISIEGRAHKAGGNSAKALADKRANALADKLARKGAGIVN